MNADILLEVFSSQRLLYLVLGFAVAALSPIFLAELHLIDLKTLRKLLFLYYNFPLHTCTISGVTKVAFLEEVPDERRASTGEGTCLSVAGGVTVKKMSMKN